MSNIPTDIKYAASHEWARNNGDGTITIGISDHAQAELGDLVYVELPEPGDSLTAGNHCAVVESTKAASDVFSPVSGEVVAVNENLNDNPELVNQNPYGDGWLLKISSNDDLSSMLDAASYEDAIAD